MQKKILTIFFLLFLTKNCPDDSYCLECVKKKGLDEFECLTCQYSILEKKKDFCEPLKVEIENCVVYNSEFPKHCLICERGFGVHSVNGKCVKCKINHCALCNEEKCLACFDSNLIYENSCRSSPYQCKEKNCEICEDSNKCMKCINGFALEDSICVKAKNFCLEGNEIACTKCEYGYYVTNKKGCKQYNKMIPQDFFTKLLIYVLSVFFIIMFSYMIYICRNKNKQDKSQIEKLIQ